MKTKVSRLWRTHLLAQHVIAVTCAILLVSSDPPVFAEQAQQPRQQQQQPAENVKISADQLDALVAPIALYPDPLMLR